MSSELRSWLKANLGKGCLGVLTSADAAALAAAHALVTLYHAADQRHLVGVELAFGSAVTCMQPRARCLAYHAIAQVGNWEDRAKLWQHAGLEPLERPGVCAYEPGGSQRS